MINFHIPDFYRFANLNSLLYHFMVEEYAPCFYENIRIGSVYGTFPGAIWNGGRTSFGSCDISTMKQITEYFNSQQIPLRFTFTNSLLNESHLYDKYCNSIMELANNGMNEVIVNNAILEKYLRKTYPNYKYILSTTASVKGAEALNDACKKYDYVVMEYNDNKNEEVIKNIDNREKIEILINESCMANCPAREAHYRHISIEQLGVNSNQNKFKCISPKSTNIFDVSTDQHKQNHFISCDELYSKYVNLGFKNFKIQGRGMPMIYTLESYLMYMVKPEYKNLIRYEFLSRLER